MKGRRVAVAWVLGSLAACSRPNGAGMDGDAGASASALEARRALRLQPVIATATTATPWSTTLMQSVLVPHGARAGTFVLRRPDTATFFGAKGFAIAAAGRGIFASHVGAHEVQPIAERPGHARVNEYLGDRSTWRTSVPTYQQVAWEELYPGIDMIAEPSRGGFAYGYVLSPGARLADVALRWEGVSSVRAAADERGVDIVTARGELRVRDLHAYAIAGAQRVELRARFTIHDTTIGVEVPEWTGDTPLVIDPTIGWSTYSGGSNSDLGNAIALDGSGNAILGGHTSSADYPTLGAFDTTYGGATDVVLTKVSSTGALLWSTYAGGAYDERANGVSTDASGNVYAVGPTWSANFPVVGGFDTTLNGQEAWVMKLSPAGAIMWSSFLGGTSSEDAGGIAVDGSGNMFVAGSTWSSDFPRNGGFDTSFTMSGGWADAFLTKISASGAIVWSTYLGGNGGDQAEGVALDSAGNPYVAGTTGSSDFPTAGGFDTTANGGSDLFITKFSSAGALLWSSYLGGSLTDYGTGVVVDGAGNAFISGITESVDFRTLNAFDTAIGGGGADMAVAKISASGVLLWSSYLGGSAPEQDGAIGIDGAGNVYVTGTTESIDFPMRGAFDSTRGGGNPWDAFVAKISSAGSLQWSSYLGGTGYERGQGVASTSAGIVYVTGWTAAPDFPISGGFDTTQVTHEAFITKIMPGTLANGAACTSGANCTSSVCSDGVCCDRDCAGKCEACTAAKKGSGTDGTCGPTPDGTDPESDCAPQSCTAGVMTRAEVCNGMAGCRATGTVPCGVYACSGASCATSCTTNSECAATAFCSGTTCIADLDNGGACTNAGQCKSGFCVDGVCCDRACGGGCEACSATLKGSGANGTCGPVAADTDPRSACAPDSGFPSSCGADGMCDGLGACRLYAKSGTACGATTCSAGIVTGYVCTGTGTCDSRATACAPYACDTSACKSSCATDADCASTAFCSSASTCIVRAAIGATCKEGRECSSGFCADGVCCNEACKGQCESCAEAGSVGTCKAISGSPAGDRPACGPCPGTCDGVDRARCAFTVGKECAATCAEGSETISTCDAAGACVASAPKSCSGFTCNGAMRCRTACTNNAECAPSFACVGSTCAPVTARCSDDLLALVEEASKRRVECAPYRCRPANAVCGTACLTNDDCSTGNVCSGAGLCGPPPPATDDDGGCSVRAPRERTGGGAAFAIAAVMLLATRRRRSA